MRIIIIIIGYFLIAPTPLSHLVNFGSFRYSPEMMHVICEVLLSEKHCLDAIKRVYFNLFNFDKNLLIPMEFLLRKPIS